MLIRVDNVKWLNVFCNDLTRHEHRRCAQYDRKAVWEHNLQILQGMLTHLQLWVSLAFSLFLFPLILITFCIIISKRSVWC